MTVVDVQLSASAATSMGAARAVISIGIIVSSAKTTLITISNIRIAILRFRRRLR